MVANQFEKIGNEAARLHNVIEVDMIRLFYEKPSPTNEEAENWILKYSKKFREVMNQNPDIAALYDDDRVQALDKIEKILYENE